MHTFYIPDIAGDTISLPETEAQHCARVLRLKAGDAIVIADGKGHLYEAKLLVSEPKKVTAQLIKELPVIPSRKTPVQLALAPTKNLDRMEWLVEKATEIGCDAFYFLKCKHSERKELKMERLEKIAISAMKQSKQPFLPQLHTMQPFSSFIKTVNPANTAIAHLTGEPDQKDLTALVKQQPVSTIFIGPEGDFSEEELALAADLNIEPVRLGNSRLRTETAALVACTTLSIFA